MDELERLEKITAKCRVKSVLARAQKNPRRAAAWERGRKIYERKMIVENVLRTEKGE